MRLVDVRLHNSIWFYGYAYGEDLTPYWTMRFYADAENNGAILERMHRR